MLPGTGCLRDICPPLPLLPPLPPLIFFLLSGSGSPPPPLLGAMCAHPSLMRDQSGRGEQVGQAQLWDPVPGQKWLQGSRNSFDQNCNRDLAIFPVFGQNRHATIFLPVLMTVKKKRNCWQNVNCSVEMILQCTGQAQC